ncbi:MAG: hypothetical protein HY067_06435 [Betaproteobacteria bacterium]|nr:hypothetical protein [Betaproteobacteria bacterium]
MAQLRSRAFASHRMIASRQRFDTQRGISLILVLVMIALATGTLAVTLLSSFGTKLRSDRVTEAALAKAKEALIAYAATDPNRPGELPCPDTNNNGQIDIGVDTAGSNCTSLVGRLPWLTLGIPDLRDGSGERLWYALSNDFHANGSVPLNSDTPGQLAVTGITPETNVVAIVFAPGPTLGGLAQSRTTANANTASQYLEGTNATSTTAFVTGDASANFNDRLITIKPAEIFRLVEKRAAHELRPLINKYYSDWGRYPFAAPFSNPTSSNFKGVVATNDGLLPVTQDPTFVAWNTVASTVTVSGGITLGGIPSCAVVAGNFLDCSVPILLSLLGQTITVTAVANNVGNALLVNPVLEPAIQYTGPGFTRDPAQFNLSLNAAAQGLIRAVGTTPLLVLPQTFHIKVPLPSFSPPVLPAWIMNNNWHHVIYYAAAPGLTPGGAGSCTLAVTPCITTPPAPGANGCLSICNRTTGVTSDNVNALIVMTGGALTGQTHPSSTLSDYLDADGNAYGNPSVSDLIYESKLVTATFNDQPFALTP